MTKLRLLFVFSALLVSLPVSAKVYELQKCVMDEGKTLDDVRAADQKYAEWAEKNDVQMPTNIELMVEFYGDVRDTGTFYRLLAFDDFTQLGEALNQRWDLGGVAQYRKTVSVQDARLAAAHSSCSQGRLFWKP